MVLLVNGNQKVCSQSKIVKSADQNAEHPLSASGADRFRWSRIIQNQTYLPECSPTNPPRKRVALRVPVRRTGPKPPTPPSGAPRGALGPTLARPPLGAGLFAEMHGARG
jgi:hypothetical protein